MYIYQDFVITIKWHLKVTIDLILGMSVLILFVVTNGICLIIENPGKLSVYYLRFSLC
jgi:hypothetical protein